MLSALGMGPVFTSFLRRVGLETLGGTRDGIDVAESEDVAAV